MRNADFSFDCREENPTKSWGNCAKSYHITEEHIRHWKKQLTKKFRGVTLSQSGSGGAGRSDNGNGNDIGYDYGRLSSAEYVGSRSQYLPRQGNKILRSPADFRALLLHDWAPFWSDSQVPTPSDRKSRSRYVPGSNPAARPEAPFLVEKDIPNAVRSLLLQELFGRERTGFVFMLRHPFASCRNFRCPATLVDQLNGWLLLYETLLLDLRHLSHFVIVHYEGLVIQPASVLSAVRETLGWRELPMEYQFHGRAVYLPPANHHVYNSTRLYNYRERVASGSADALTTKIAIRDDFNAGSEQMTRRLAGYKRHSGISSVSGKLQRSPLVTIETSDEAIEWSFNYDHELQVLRSGRLTDYNQLLAMEKRLNKFCYSIHTLTPICTHQEQHQYTGQMQKKLSYIYRQSKESLSSIDPVIPEKLGEVYLEGTEAIRLKLANILFEPATKIVSAGDPVN